MASVLGVSVRRSHLIFLLLGPLALSGCGSAPGSATLTGSSSQYGVQLSWSAGASADPVVSYNVYREQTAGFAQINSSPVTTTSYMDSSTASGQAYVYMVESVDGNGNVSDPSDTVSVSVP
jgi:fibronectin type 3 domain-containing protein